MMNLEISSPETMERAICELGIVPFFTSAIPGYSIKELTQPGFWFDGEEDSLGPWDWKIDCLQNREFCLSDTQMRPIPHRTIF